MSFRASVIIPTINDVTLKSAIEAVLQQTRQPEEIIVVGLDDAGIASGYPQVRFVDTGQAVCAAAARNRGIAASSGNLIVLTDSDCIPDRCWLEQHIRAHEAGHQVVGGSISLAGSNFWAQADNVSMFHDFVAEHGPDDRPLLPTLNLSIEREVIDAVGFLDESFPGAAAEDSDWTVRMRRAKYRLYFDPSPVVLHSPSRTRWSDVVRHWRNLGYSSIRVRLRYADEFRTPRFARSAFLMRLLSPLIAARVTLGIYAQPIFWRHLRYAPVVYLTKIIYCLGAARSIDHRFAFCSDRIFPHFG